MNRIDGGAAGARSALGAAFGLLLAVGVWGVANAQPAPGSQPDHNAASAQPKKQDPDPDDKVICKVEEETGTRLGSNKVCHTRREWEQIRKDSADLVNNLGREAGRPK